MNVEIYQPEKHFFQLLQWYKSWELDEQVIDLLPQTGLIIPDKAALFMYETNSKVAILEGFIVNPKVPAEERTQYFDKLGEVMLHIAKEQGYKYMTGNTKIPNVKKQLEKFGFSFTDQTYHFFYKVIQ